MCIASRVCVGVCASVLKGQSSCSVSQKCMLSAYLCAHICFKRDFAIIPHFIFRIPLEVEMCLVFFYYYYYLALVIPFSQWSGRVCFSFLVIRGFYHSIWAWNLNTCIRQEVAWAENQITLEFSPNVWGNIPGLFCPSFFCFFFYLFDASLLCLQWSQTDSSWRILLIKIKACKICSSFINKISTNLVPSVYSMSEFWT